jgi:hypothetical protein
LFDRLQRAISLVVRLERGKALERPSLGKMLRIQHPFISEKAILSGPTPLRGGSRAAVPYIFL